MSMGCGSTDTGLPRKCGDYYGGSMVLCGACESEFAKRFPQGWRYYPGDVCQHGVYVGGCGIDYMCWYCEMGIEPEPAETSATAVS